MEEFTAVYTCHNDLKEFKVNVNLMEINLIRRQTERLTVVRHPAPSQSCRKEFLSSLGAIFPHLNASQPLACSSSPSASCPAAELEVSHVSQQEKTSLVLCTVSRNALEENLKLGMQLRTSTAVQPSQALQLVFCS